MPSQQQSEHSFPRPTDSARNNARPPMQQSGSMSGMERPRDIGNGDNQRHRPVEDRPASRPSYSDHGAGAAPVQQAERSTPMPHMSPPSESRPAMQPPQRMPEAPRASEPPHSSAPAPHASGGGNSGGSRGSQPHGNSQSSGHDHGNAHDNDSKPKN